MARVSILLPVFDAAKTLPACLASVARQTERDFECLVVDDGSTDGSLELAQRLAERDSRFRVLPAPHEGLVPALNSGLDACRAPLVARMDADDWMHRERLSLQCAALDTDPTLAAVGAHVRCFPREALGPGMRAYEAWLASVDSPRRVREERFVECPVAHPTLLMRRDRLRKLRYRDAGWPEDYDLILRLLAVGGRIGVVPRRLLGWRHTPERLSRTSETYDPARLAAVEARYEPRVPIPWTPGAPDDPALRALAVYHARAYRQRMDANTTIRDLKRDPGSGVLLNRLRYQIERFRIKNRFYWAQRRRLGWMDFKPYYLARQAAKREAAE